MRMLLLLWLPLALLPGCATTESYDVVVYGTTPAGVTAAVQAARMDRRVALVAPDDHVGGILSGGHGVGDTGNRERAVGGLAREFFERVRDHYDQSDAWPRTDPGSYFSRSDRNEPDAEAMWTWEPHIAGRIFHDMLEEAGVEVVRDVPLDRKQGVSKGQRRILAIYSPEGRGFAARVFIDATYEGDLMAAAGVDYTLGREPNSRYGERFNGVQKRLTVNHQFNDPIDPYTEPGDDSSGVLPGLHSGRPPTDGSGDQRLQAYSFRLCLTRDPLNRIPFRKPEGYDPDRYELLARYLEAGFDDILANQTLLPNRKFDVGSYGPFSFDFVMGNYDYPEASDERREEIVAEHRRYQRGLLYFLANDPRVPQRIRRRVGSWGLAADEFEDNEHWPPQLYIREARRMIGAYVMTEHDIFGRRRPPKPVALGAFGIDSHNTQRYVDSDGRPRTEGAIYIGGFEPYPISYLALCPSREQVSNLLVPVCLSASHSAYSSIRMEPTFMALGQASGAAAAIAASGETPMPVQDVPYAELRDRLLADGAVLELSNGSTGMGENAPPPQPSRPAP